jgi:hypothetical protein
VNTDGFDVAGDDVTIENSFVYNQDDCLAINRGTGITFKNNYCSGGHGISIVSDIPYSGIHANELLVRRAPSARRQPSLESRFQTTKS